jgi:hypothetical protein
MGTSSRIESSTCQINARDIAHKGLISQNEHLR